MGQPLVHSLGLALPECFLVGFITEQGLFKLRQNVVRDADRLQDLPETVGHNFLAKIGQVAFAPITGAAVRSPCNSTANGVPEPTPVTGARCHLDSCG